MTKKYIVKDGRSLFRYCKDTGVAYDAMLYRILKCNMTPDEAIATPTNKPVHHFVDGINLAQFCREHGLNYQTIHSKHRLLYPEMPMDEFVYKHMKGELRKKSISRYYKEKGLDYDKLYDRWYTLHSDKYTIAEYIDLHEKGITKTSLEFIPATVYCRQHGYDYYLLQRLYRRTRHRCNTFKDFIRKWETDNGYSSEAA